jgi:hypothetical protein
VVEDLDVDKTGQYAFYNKPLFKGGGRNFGWKAPWDLNAVIFSKARFETQFRHIGETLSALCLKFSRLAFVPTHSPFNAVLLLEVKGTTSCWPIASIYCQDYECVEHYPDSPHVFVVLSHRNNFILVLSSKICQEFHHAADALPTSLLTHARIRAVQQRIVVPSPTGERVQRRYLHNQSPS